MRDLTEGMPWIYPPYQVWIYLLIIGSCGYLSWRISKDWVSMR